MKNLLLSLIAAASVSALAVTSQLKMITAAELNAAMAKHEQIHIFDANLDSTRKQVGIIPGAILLSSYDNYDLKNLPSDKSSRLVFYCADKMCSASSEAAKRAIEAGYSSVSVLKDGIYGWQNAGKKLAKFEGASSEGAAEIDPKAAINLVKENKAVIVDVREAEERHQIIENEKWLPMSKVKDQQAWTEFKSKLPKNGTVIFHCASGIRAKRAADQLAADGIKSMFFKGPDQWRSAGLPLVPGPAK